MSKMYSKLKGLQQQRSGKAQEMPLVAPLNIEDQEVTDARMIPETEITTESIMAASPKKESILRSPGSQGISDVEKKQFPIRLIFIALGLGIAFLAGGLLSNLAILKNSSMNLTIQAQQNEIVMLKKKLGILQTSMNKRMKQVDDANKSLNQGLQDKIDNLNSSVEAKFDSTTANMNRIEAVLQSNIDELNAKFNKLQSSIPTTSPKTGDQT